MVVFITQVRSLESVMVIMVSTMAREKLKLNPTPLDKLLLVSLLPMPMLLDTPTMLDTLPMSPMDLDMVMVFTMAREKLKLSQNHTPLDKLLLVSLSIMPMPLATHTMLDTLPMSPMAMVSHTMDKY